MELHGFKKKHSMYILPFVHVTLYNVTPSLISRNLGETDVLISNLPLHCHISLSYITDLTFRIIHQRVPNTRSHTLSCCLYHNVDFVVFNNVTSYTNYL
jgi:hypothetical protein